MGFGIGGWLSEDYLPFLFQPDGLLGVAVGVDNGYGSGSMVGSSLNGGNGTGQHLTDGQDQQDDTNAQTLHGDHSQGSQQSGNDADNKGTGYHGKAHAFQEVMTEGAALCNRKNKNYYSVDPLYCRGKAVQPKLTSNISIGLLVTGVGIAHDSAEEEAGDQQGAQDFLLGSHFIWIVFVGGANRR